MNALIPFEAVCAFTVELFVDLSTFLADTIIA